MWVSVRSDSLPERRGFEPPVPTSLLAGQKVRRTGLILSDELRSNSKENHSLPFGWASMIPLRVESWLRMDCVVNIRLVASRTPYLY